MKKLLYFVPTFPNITETFITREVVELIKLGNLDIHIFSFKKGNAQIPPSIKGVTFYLDSIPKNYFSAGFFCLRKFFRFISLISLIKKNGDNKFFSNLYLGVKSIYYASIFEKGGYDQIHCHFLSEVSSLMLFVSYLLDIPISISGHATDVFKNASLINMKVLMSKSILLCNSLAYEKVLKDSGGKGRKNVILMYHGIDPHLFRFRQRDLSYKNKINIITDGRFVPKKGLKILSQAVVCLLKEGFNLNLTIIGVAQDVEQKKHLDEIIDVFKSSGFISKLVIPGSGQGISQKEVALEYDKADLFIYAGIDDNSGDVDGVPNALLQACFSGLPIISTDSGSISDLLDESNSSKIPQNEIDGIVLAFKELVESNHYKNKVLLSFRKVSREFNISLNSIQLEQELLK